MRNKKLITFLVFWILYLVNLLQCYLCNWTFDFPPSHHWKCSTNIVTGRCISHINVNLFQTHTCTTYLYALIKLIKYPFIRHSLNLASLKEIQRLTSPASWSLTGLSFVPCISQCCVKVPLDLGMNSTFT